MPPSPWRFLPNGNVLVPEAPLDESVDLISTVSISRAPCPISRVLRVASSSRVLFQVNQDPVGILIGRIRTFTNLRNLTLPLDVIHPSLIQCLMNSNIRELTLAPASSSVEGNASLYQTNSMGHWVSLEVLTISAPLVVSCSLLRSVSPLSLNIITMNAPKLQNETEMRDTVDDIVRYCPILEVLKINIHSLANGETADWMDLTGLRRCDVLQELSICHPRPLRIGDSQIHLLIRDLSHLTYASLNPHPSMPPWRITRAVNGHLPTLGCLYYLAAGDGLRLSHLGVYLNPLEVITLPANKSRVKRSEKLTLDLGTFGGRGSKTARLAADIIRDLFLEVKLIAKDDNLEWTRRVANRLI